MKRITLLFMTLVTVFMLIGCNQTKSDTIVIWHDKEEAVIEVLENILKEQLPDVDVSFVRKESLTDTLKLVGNSQKSAPDMYIFAHDKIGVFVEMGILSPITDFLSEDVFDDYVELTKEAATYKQNMYQLPLYYETLLFLYNRDRMSDEEVPSTTEELYAYMQANTDARRYGFVEQYSNSYYSAGWIHGFNGTLIDSQGVPKLDTEEVIKALKYHEKFIEYMPQGQAEYATVNTLFLEKKANSIIAGPWLVPLARENDINLGFASMPLIDETNQPISPYAGVQGVHVLKVAAELPERKAKITQILNVLKNPEVGVRLAVASGVAPANNLAYQDERIKDDELVIAMRNAADLAIPMPNLPQMDIMWTTVSNMLTQIYLNDADIETQVSNAQEESKNLIALMN